MVTIELLTMALACKEDIIDKIFVPYFTTKHGGSAWALINPQIKTITEGSSVQAI
jgi:hypothetical protein